MITVDLRRPPSVNALFANIGGKGRVKTAAYRAWVSEAAWEIRLAARAYRIEGRFGIVIVLGACPGHSPDVDNMIKPIVDALVRAGVTADDRDLDGVIAVRSGRGAFVAGPDRVRVEALTAGAFFERFARGGP